MKYTFGIQVLEKIVTYFILFKCNSSVINVTFEVKTRNIISEIVCITNVLKIEIFVDRVQISEEKSVYTGFHF